MNIVHYFSRVFVIYISSFLIIFLLYQSYFLDEIALPFLDENKCVEGYCLHHSYNKLELPSPKTHVKVNLEVLDIIRVDDRKFSVELNMYFGVVWTEPRLKLPKPFKKWNKSSRSQVRLKYSLSKNTYNNQIIWLRYIRSILINQIYLCTIWIHLMPCFHFKSFQDYGSLKNKIFSTIR